jgi:ubiquinone/menaquinone biosynthesis C-methylase UbiE
MYYRIFFPFYQWAAQKMCHDCQDFIKKGERLLDLGCGSGIVAKAFQDFFQAKVIGVDIRDQRIFNFPFEIIDGKTLPFSEKSFDTVLISYVLHHSNDPVALLKEAKRVSKKIIIYEDLPETLLSKIYCKFHSITFNKFFQKNSNSSFKTSEEWEKIFQKIGLTIIFKKRINNFPVKKELYILGT